MRKVKILFYKESFAFKLTIFELEFDIPNYINYDNIIRDYIQSFNSLCVSKIYKYEVINEDM